MVSLIYLAKSSLAQKPLTINFIVNWSTLCFNYVGHFSFAFSIFVIAALLFLFLPLPLLLKIFPFLSTHLPSQYRFRFHLLLLLLLHFFPTNFYAGSFSIRGSQLFASDHVYPFFLIFALTSLESPILEFGPLNKREMVRKIAFRQVLLVLFLAAKIVFSGPALPETIILVIGFFFIVLGFNPIVGTLERRIRKITEQIMKLQCRAARIKFISRNIHFSKYQNCKEIRKERRYNKEKNKRIKIFGAMQEETSSYIQKKKTWKQSEKQNIKNKKIQIHYDSLWSPNIIICLWPTIKLTQTHTVCSSELFLYFWLSRFYKNLFLHYSIFSILYSSIFSSFLNNQSKLFIFFMENQQQNPNLDIQKPSLALAPHQPCPLFLGHKDSAIKLLEFLDGLPYSIFITIITLITLFADDFREIFFSPSSDQTFSIITLICMGFYTVEMIILSFIKQGYFLRYYFWLDLISTLSMILDLSWVTALINGNGVESASKVVKIAKASRASKIGARSTKLIRIIRLIRFLRLYKTAKKQLNQENEKKMLGDQIKALKNNLGDERSPRKTSKRMERVRQASVGGQSQNAVRSNGNGEMKEKRSSRHQVSLKNIAFEGSQRRLSVLHPSKNLGRGSNKVIQKQKFPSGEIKLSPIPDANSNSRQPKVVEKIKSQDNVMSEDQNYPQNPDQGQSGEQIQVRIQTKVGTKLKQEIQKNVVSMILLILISIPLLNSDTWFSNITSYEKSIKQLNFLANRNRLEFDGTIPTFITSMMDKPQPLVYFSVYINQTCCQFPTNFSDYRDTVKNLDQIRPGDILVYVQALSQNLTTTLAFDQTPQTKFSCQLNIGRTIFICLVLIVITLLFTRDVEIEALQPLQNMIDTVKKISSNPLQAVKDIEKENMIKQAILQKGGNLDNQQELLMLAKEDKKDKTEPTLLQNMIIKIGSLLAVGFGEAGTELIAQNIENYGSLNVMMPGKKVMCIFGFCDIRNFTDATQVLEAKVMVFVNEIAQICHEVVNRVGGNPNKNIGDAFLLVWKFQEDDTITVQKKNVTDIQLRSSLKVKQTADLAVYSFVKMIAEIARSHELQKYKHNQGLKKRIKNYEGVKMGFGLHVGWAIEGPIGSEFKIDASYLGPHVNFSGQLEAATKHYGASMLISQSLYQLMTLKNKEHLRLVDIVKINGSQAKSQQDEETGQVSMGLYTVDISISNLLKSNGVNEKKQLSLFEKKKIKVFHNQQRDKLMSMIEKKRVTGAIWNDDKDIKALRQPFTKFFYDEWKQGFDAYKKGNWDEAKEVFKRTLVLGLNHQDGPSQALLNFMEQNQYIPPDNWNGSRQFVG